MITKSKFIVVAFALLVLSAGTMAQSLDDVLQKYYKAEGGLDRLKSKTTMRATGKMMMQGMELPFVAIKKRPNLFYFELTLQGQKIIQGFDGTSGWAINPMTGSSDPIEIPSEQMKMVREQADFDGMLVDWKDKGEKLELIGKEDVEGADAFHIKVTTKDTLVRHVFLDADSYLEIQSRGKNPAQGRDIEVTSSTGGYKLVDSIMVPFSTEAKVEGKSIQQMLLDSVQYNVAVADTLFAHPKPKK